jgi:GNAT superfamily N-acetyltransferase
MGHPPGRSEDAASIASLILPVFRAGDTYTVDPGITEDEALAYWCAPDKTVFLAEDGSGRALGTYYIRPNAGGGGRHVCNCGYITADAARGRGVARAMLAHSLDRGARQGYRAMQFNFVVATNDRAVDTWSARGSHVGRLPGAFRHPAHGFVDALVMWRDLPMTPLSLRAGLPAAAMWSSPLLADAVLSLGAGDRTLDIAPSGIADMDISESGGITDVFLRLMPGASGGLRRASPATRSAEP